MRNYSGHYFIDGQDIWTAFSMIVERGSDDFLKYPAKKDSTTHDWMDSNGVDVDLSRVFLNPREIALSCAMIVTSKAEFWEKYQALLNVLTQPGKRRITVAAFGHQHFYCHYSECTTFQRFSKLEDNLIGTKFLLRLVENEPKLDNRPILLSDEAGRVIAT